MDDLISRRAAIDAMEGLPKYFDKTDTLCLDYADVLAVLSEHLPSAQPERKKGEWILVKGSNGKDYHKCSECLHTQDITGVKNYCVVCGADMRGEQNEVG
jgi:hypothetical protein